MRGAVKPGTDEVRAVFLAAAAASLARNCADLNTAAAQRKAAALQSSSGRSFEQSGAMMRLSNGAGARVATQCTLLLLAF